MTPFCSLKNKRERKFNCTCFCRNLLVAFDLPMPFGTVCDCGSNRRTHCRLRLCTSPPHQEQTVRGQIKPGHTPIPPLRLTTEHNRGIFFTSLLALTKLYLLSLSPSCLSSSWRPQVPSSALAFRPSFALNRGGVLPPPRRS